MEMVEVRLDTLLVDDNAIDAMFFARAVKKSGLNLAVQFLPTGQQAIEYLEAKGQFADRSRYPLPDLIVLDLKMPQVNGFEFLAWRRASGFFSAIPVIVFSGSGDPEEVSRVFELGAEKHIIKPAAWEDWEKVVREIWDFSMEQATFWRVGEAKQRAGS